MVLGKAKSGPSRNWRSAESCSSRGAPVAVLRAVPIGGGTAESSAVAVADGNRRIAIPASDREEPSFMEKIGPPMTEQIGAGGLGSASRGVPRTVPSSIPEIEKMCAKWT